MKKSLVILALASLLGACGANIDDLVEYTTEIKKNTAVSIEPYPEFTSLPLVDYDADELRSPFVRSTREQIPEEEIAQRPNCEQPNLNRRKHPLEAYGLDGLQMAGVFTNNGRKYALVKANDGTLHKVTYGSFIGLFHGRVTKISNAEISIKEMLPDGGGCWQSKEATLTMSPMVGDNDDV